MGSYHNLFGLPNEAHVFVEADGRYHLSKIVQGSKIQDMVQFARYETSSLIANFQKRVYGLVAMGKLSETQAQSLTRDYTEAATWSTYLEG